MSWGSIRLSVRSVYFQSSVSLASAEQFGKGSRIMMIFIYLRSYVKKINFCCENHSKLSKGLSRCRNSFPLNSWSLTISKLLIKFFFFWISFSLSDLLIQKDLVSKFSILLCLQINLLYVINKKAKLIVQ